MQQVIDGLVAGDIACFPHVSFHTQCARAIAGLERLVRAKEGLERWLVLDPEDRDADWAPDPQDPEKRIYEPDLGLIRREPTAMTDGKYYFHENHRFDALLPRDLARQHWRWLRELSQIRLQAECLASEIIYRLSVHLRDPEIWTSYHRSRHLHKLRFLLYDPATDKPVARPHYDRAFLTLHLADNFPGLFVERREGDTPEVIPTSNGNVLAFLGYKAAVATGKRLQPLWHGGSVLPPGTKRWAVVYFVHTDHVLPTDWRATRRPASQSFGL